jgi:hypothetical protein
VSDKIIPLELMYPDVLGAITGGARINMDALQLALGIFPRQAYLNQPVEVVLILQNMVDQPMQLKVALQLPTRDKKGNVTVIDTPKNMLSMGMQPGEVGVLRIPIVALPPTQPGSDLPVHVAVRYRTAKPGQQVRPPTGGVPPSVLSVSPFKMQVLREIKFIARPWHESNDILTVSFDVAPKKLPPPQQTLSARYETLWAQEEVAEERQLARNKMQDARRVATMLTRYSSYVPLMQTIDEIYTRRGLPLHPGEVKAIAKLLVYTLEDGLELEPGFSVEKSRWFQTLCRLLVSNPELERKDGGEIAVSYLLQPALYDAILLAFALIQHKVREDLGDERERVNYANRFLIWFNGQGEPDLTYVYLPLVMGGVVINQIATRREDNPWIMLDELREASRGRARLVSGEASTIFRLMDQLLEEGEDELRRARIPRMR